jgi:hypothetical protein
MVPSTSNTRAGRRGRIGVAKLLTTLQEQRQAVFPSLTGFLPGSELKSRLFRWRALPGPYFPCVAFGGRTAMLHFDVKLIRIDNRLRI